MPLVEWENKTTFQIVPELVFYLISDAVNLTGKLKSRQIYNEMLMNEMFYIASEVKILIWHEI